MSSELADSPIARQVMQNLTKLRELEKVELAPPRRTRFVAFANQKGGVGKTTSVVNFAAAIARAGLHVLVVDIDPQGNASTALNIAHHQGAPSTYNVLVEGADFAQCVQSSPVIPNLEVLPATIDLAGAEIELVDVPRREYTLRQALENYVTARRNAGQPRLDYVFIDCPPSLGLLTLNAFVGADEVVIPIQCEYYALEGLSQLLANIEKIKQVFHAGLHVTAILLTMYDARTNLAQDVAAEIETHFPEIVLHTKIPRSVRVAEAPSFDRTVIEHDPRSAGAVAYLAAAYEFAQKEEVR